jgi:hypothetical protein
VYERIYVAGMLPVSYTNQTVEASKKISHLSFQNYDSRCIGMFK